MTREEAKEFYPILQAFAKGKAIECRTKPSAVKGTSVPNDWAEMKEIEFWNNTEYRVKPESKYRPFKDAEECWAEMQKHQPFGWLKSKENGYYSFITMLNNRFRLNGYDGWWFDDTIKKFTFADCTPFGVKVEE
jgi:hypothetical protein